MLRRLIQTGGPVLILIFFTLWGEYLWFGDIVLHPNRYVFVFNADGKQICFNFMYHLKYGHGFTLSNQNYPFYEFICMTDAQAAVSVICHFIQEHIMNIEPWAMGIFNGFILYTLPFCSLFLYGIFRELAMGRLFSVVFALLICFLSPQMLRLTNGHYGLAYLFVIPAIYFFLLKMVRSGHAGFYFLMVIGTGMCIGINNGHLALAAGIQILSFALVYLFLFRTDSGYKKWLPLLSFIVLMSFFFFFIHSMDSASDRELHPWGFFTFYSQLSSYFLPTYGFFYNKLHSFFPASAFEIEGEGTAYLGTLALLLPVFILLRIAFRTIRYHSLRWPYRNNMVLVFLISLLPVMLYSMALPFRWGLESWVYRIPFLGQFRVPGRFSWIVYYAFGIVLGYTLYILIRWLRRKHRVFPFLLWIPILLFYGTDIVSASRFVMRFSSGENHFPSNPFLEKQEWKKDLQQHAIDTQHVQCILGLPVFNAWSSKFGIDTDPDSLVTRMVMISTETGLPWMNAKLSRIAVSPLMQSTQMGSHPVIVKEILQHLPSRKKIVLIHLNSYS
ncbi:MAG TPA: hypothetical protein PLP14_05190, partial [Chitinophagaceae bacterium]|nr:hypothetical protein [Chitinophagaceae bacterium]